ncbi:MAG: hypothetical protein CMF38_02555 [Legionellaceae bacterium]|nr:hypothetical protein [Legionellaceae bacterium]HCA89986.1 hypothetical protein [Legionellales bacterium]|tara:strand:- start:590 stop:1099 length:510 start_codon:yes stop_codon:yes gene_type:complete
MYEIIHSLRSRLPELEWHLSKLNAQILPILHASQLFCLPSDASYTHCIAQIEWDIERLEEPLTIKMQHYLVKKIQQRINFLVKICLVLDKKSSEAIKNIVLEGCMTPQQRQQLIYEIWQTLIKQEQALIEAKQYLPSSIKQAKLAEDLNLLRQKRINAQKMYENLTSIR